jgi:hypothetical protein
LELEKDIKMKLYVAFIFAFSTLLLWSCEQQVQPNNVQKNQPQQSQNQQNEIQKDSPIWVLKTFIEAKNNKDAETMKQTISKSTLETISGVAKSNGTTNEFLKRGNTTPLNKPEMPETRNEKITGETASVEIKRSATDKWTELPFVKEDGRWKMNLNKYLDNIFSK